LDPSAAAAAQMPKQVLEVNTNHALIKRLDILRVEKPDFAKMMAEQVNK
jgi:hypothetical protein